MALKRIVDASPLIYLNRVGLLGILDEPGVTVLVPDAVLSEVTRLVPNDPTAVDVTSAPWIQIVSAPAIPTSVRTFRLGAGESAALALALVTLPTLSGTGRALVVEDNFVARLAHGGVEFCLLIVDGVELTVDAVDHRLGIARFLIFGDGERNQQHERAEPKK